MSEKTEPEVQQGDNVISLKGKLPKSPEDQRTLNKKWSKTTLDANYTIVPRALLRGQARLGINANDLAVLIHLLDHWWQAEAMPWPSKKTIAERLSVNEKTVQRAMKRLEDANLIQRNERYHNTGGRTSNEYDLSPLVERLKPIAEELVKADEAARAIKKKAERPGLKKRGKAS